jgi:ABC-type dipeptide/oligopeptide/nickel transport system ATPase component/ABC-type dipeptide/oligopeptide/nickel transport system permease subunit
MSMSETVIDPTLTTSQTRSGTVKRLLHDPVGVATAVILLLFILASILAPLLTPWDPNATDLSSSRLPPGTDGHVLGTDAAGRDVFSRLLFGGQVTFASAALASIVAIVIGVASGLIAGYYGGWFDTVSLWFSNMLMSLPAIIVLLAARAALGPSVWISMAIFGVIFSPTFYRLVRSSVQGVRNELYVDAARVAGLSDTRIIGRHILTVVRAPIIIQVAIVAGITIAVQAGLEFLGLGDSSVPTWGMMLNDGFRLIFLDPVLVVWPVLAIAIVTTAFALLGNALRDALEDDEKPPSMRKRRSAQSAADRAEPADAQAGTAAVDRGHLLIVHGLRIGYPQADGSIKKVVDGVDFTVDRGEVLGIVGESGSGKTQTAFAILGLLPENAEIVGGHIVFDGIDLVSPEKGRISSSRMDQLRGTRIAYVPQEPMSNLDPAFTIGYQLTRPLIKLMKLTKAQAHARAVELLEIVGIPDPERTLAAYPHEISGGMAQRVLIAGAVSCEPDLLVADEPTTALDVTVQAEVLDLLRDLNKRLGMGVLIVTHNFGVVADLCDRVVVMQKSKLVEQGGVRDVLSRPREAYTRELLDSMLENKPPLTMLLGNQQGQR